MNVSHAESMVAPLRRNTLFQHFEQIYALHASHLAQSFKFLSPFNSSQTRQTVVALK